MRELNLNSIKKNPKIITFNKACKIAEKLKKEGKTTAFTTGIFDILHMGHINYLKCAKMTAKVLFVGLESDKTATNVKGAGRPVNNINDRLGVLASLESVDYVFALKEDLKNYKNAHTIFTNRDKKIKTTYRILPKGIQGIEMFLKQIEKAGMEAVLVDTPLYGQLEYQGTSNNN